MSHNRSATSDDKIHTDTNTQSNRQEQKESLEDILKNLRNLLPKLAQKIKNLRTSTSTKRTATAARRGFLEKKQRELATKEAALARLLTLVKNLRVEQNKREWTGLTFGLFWAVLAIFIIPTCIPKIPTIPPVDGASLASITISAASAMFVIMNAIGSFCYKYLYGTYEKIKSWWTGIPIPTPSPAEAATRVQTASLLKEAKPVVTNNQPTTEAAHSNTVTETHQEKNEDEENPLLNDSKNDPQKSEAASTASGTLALNPNDERKKIRVSAALIYNGYKIVNKKLDRLTEAFTADEKENEAMAKIEQQSLTDLETALAQQHNNILNLLKIFDEIEEEGRQQHLMSRFVSISSAIVVMLLIGLLFPVSNLLAFVNILTTGAGALSLGHRLGSIFYSPLYKFLSSCCKSKATPFEIEMETNPTLKDLRKNTAQLALTAGVTSLSPTPPVSTVAFSETQIPSNKSSTGVITAITTNTTAVVATTTPAATATTATTASPTSPSTGTGRFFADTPPQNRTPPLAPTMPVNNGSRPATGTGSRYQAAS